MKLLLKSTAAVLVVFVALLGILGYAQILREARQFETQAVGDLLLTGRSLGPVIEEVSKVEGRARALQAVERSNAGLAHAEVGWVSVADAPLTAEQRGRLQRGAEVELIDRSPEGTNRAHVFLPILLAGDPPVAQPGDPPVALELSRALVEEDAAIHGVIEQQAVGTAAMALGGTVVASLVGFWFVARPVRRLVEQARRIGQGDFSYHATVRQRDEVGDLAREMSAMASRLEETQSRLAAENEGRIRALEQLRHADRLTTVGTLAAGMAHELGTPLNVVAGRAKMIAGGRLEPDAAVANARIIGTQVDRIVKIIRQLLDFARRGDAARAPVDLRGLAGRTIAMLEPMARERGVAIELQCTESPADVLGDASQLEQVLTNLIVNGLQAMGKGVLHVRVDRAEQTPPPDHGGARAEFLRVEVRDEGKGIEPAHLGRVFEPFFTTKGVGEGTGLGLSVAYGIVRDHGGWISVSSQPAVGSSFAVQLPPAGRA
jgi:signal transduction histidine kinase